MPGDRRPASRPVRRHLITPSLPDAAESATQSSSDGDGSDASAFKAQWWRKYFTGDRAQFWPEELENCPLWKVNHEYQVITREDVFAIASVDARHVHARTAVAAYVWGVGKSAYQVGRMVRALTNENDPSRVEDRLGRAAAVLAKDGPVVAYGTLLPSGENYIKFMGAAYFTKFLFFTGYRVAAEGSLRPLILDKRVATALRAWHIRTGWPDRGWTPNQYQSYLQYAARQQEQPEQVERRLFLAGDRKTDPGPRPDRWSGQ